jgi:hypothetical protein
MRTLSDILQLTILLSGIAVIGAVMAGILN